MSVDVKEEDEEKGEEAKGDENTEGRGNETE